MRVPTFLFAAIILFCANAARAQQPDAKQPSPHFTAEDRQSMRDWYEIHRDELPLGVRRKDRLPADLEKQLVPGAPLPESLRDRVQKVSADFLGRVPMLNVEYKYVFIGGHAVLLGAKDDYVYDVFHFEKKHQPGTSRHT